jgi:hypothetical protein
MLLWCVLQSVHPKPTVPDPMAPSQSGYRDQHDGLSTRLSLAFARDQAENICVQDRMRYVDRPRTHGCRDPRSPCRDGNPGITVA